MSQSLSQIYLHLIFSTKNRENIILRQYKDALHAYIAGTFNSLLCPAIVVGGTENHVHVLFRFNTTTSISEIVRTVKSHSTTWIKDKMHCNFAWQSGYGIFSVSQSKLETVRRYIENQEEHHRVKTFMEEYTEFMKEYNVNYDEHFL